MIVRISILPACIYTHFWLNSLPQLQQVPSKGFLKEVPTPPSLAPQQSSMLVRLALTLVLPSSSQLEFSVKQSAKYKSALITMLPHILYVYSLKAIWFIVNAELLNQYMCGAGTVYSKASKLLKWDSLICLYLPTLLILGLMSLALKSIMLMTLVISNHLNI